MWRRVHSRGGEKLKGEIDKSCIRSRGKITSNSWLTSPVIMTLYKSISKIKSTIGRSKGKWLLIFIDYKIDFYFNR